MGSLFNSQKIIYKTAAEIEIMREAAQIVSRTLGLIAAEIKPGITTIYLDQIAEEYIRSQNAIPGFLGMYDFPNTLCISVNEEVVPETGRTIISNFCAAELPIPKGII